MKSRTFNRQRGGELFGLIVIDGQLIFLSEQCNGAQTGSVLGHLPKQGVYPAMVFPIGGFRPGVNFAG